MRIKFNFILVIITLLITVNGYCGEKGKNKSLIEFQKKGIFGKYINKSEYPFYCMIGISEDDKFIIFTDPENELSLSSIRGIPFANYKIDMDANKISFYLDTGELIITLEFIDDKHFKVSDYGKWLYYSIENKEYANVRKKILDIAFQSVQNFGSGNYSDIARIYEVQ